MAMLIEKCPHCEGIGTIWSDNGSETVYAVCLSCGCRTKEFRSVEEAAESWNKRVIKLVGVANVLTGTNIRPVREQHKPYEGPIFKNEGRYVSMVKLKSRLLDILLGSKSKEEKKTVSDIVSLIDNMPTITISGGESK